MRSEVHIYLALLPTASVEGRIRVAGEFALAAWLRRGRARCCCRRHRLLLLRVVLVQLADAMAQVGGRVLVGV